MENITGDELSTKITTNQNLFESRIARTNKQLEELRLERVKLLCSMARGEKTYSDLYEHDNEIADLERFAMCYPDLMAACNSEMIIAEGLNDFAKADEASRDRYFKLKAERSLSSESDYPRRLRHLAEIACLMPDCEKFLAEELQ